MIDNVLWWIWHIVEFAAVVLGWYVILRTLGGFLRGAREAVQEHRRGTPR